jgi:hypothetical protein
MKKPRIVPFRLSILPSPLRELAIARPAIMCRGFFGVVADTLHRTLSNFARSVFIRIIDDFRSLRQGNVPSVQACAHIAVRRCPVVAWAAGVTS